MDVIYTFFSVGRNWKLDELDLHAFSYRILATYFLTDFYAKP